MNLSDSAEEAEFRAQLRAWLIEHHPGPMPSGDDASFDLRRTWQRELNAAGYVGLSWPKEFGGAGAALTEQAIVLEEAARARVPQPANVVGLSHAGPVIIEYGTEYQKTRYLPKILSAQEIWCQGFSEPSSGSDLSSVRTRAVFDDGRWLVTGQKVWTSFGHYADMCILLARTSTEGARHRGLTFFLLPMRQEGVEIRPLRQASGESEFNELFLDNAVVPAENVLGAVGDGWRVAMSTLGYERATIGVTYSSTIQQTFRDLLKLCHATGAVNRESVRQELARFYTEANALRLCALSVLCKQAVSGAPGADGSMTKWQWSNLSQAMSEFAMDILEEQGILAASEWTYRFLRSRANSIEGGTTDIQKGIVAERVLGLPRAAR